MDFYFSYLNEQDETGKEARDSNPDFLLLIIVKPRKSLELPATCLKQIREVLCYKLWCEWFSETSSGQNTTGHCNSCSAGLFLAAALKKWTPSLAQEDDSTVNQPLSASGPAGRRLLPFRKYSSVVVSVFVCKPPACRTPWHAFWVSESHNLLLEFGRHVQGCIFLFCKTAGSFQDTKDSSCRERARYHRTCDSEPTTSRSINVSFLGQTCW